MKPETFRGVVRDLVRAMQTKAQRHHLRDQYDFDRGDASSAQKAMYGDTWLLLYGVDAGIGILRNNAHVEVEGQTFDIQDRKYEISDEAEWQEHYNKYGSGPYGEGLKLGRELAFYNDRDFTFTELDDDKDDGYEHDFTFTS